MANWCSTQITINHENENKLEELENKINEWMNPKDTSDFGNSWLGNIVINSGVGTVDENANTDCRCRGSVIDMYRSGNELYIYTETAWVPMLKMWTRLLDKYLPDAELLYSADECGCEIYSTNDPNVVGRYVIDIFEDIGSFESNWDATTEDVVEILQSLLKTEETDIGKLFEMLDESDFNNDMSIHQWEYASVDEWD